MALIASVVFDSIDVLDGSFVCETRGRLKKTVGRQGERMKGHERLNSATRRLVELFDAAYIPLAEGMAYIRGIVRGRWEN